MDNTNTINKMIDARVDVQFILFDENLYLDYTISNASTRSTKKIIIAKKNILAIMA